MIHLMNVPDHVLASMMASPLLRFPTAANPEFQERPCCKWLWEKDKDGYVSVTQTLEITRTGCWRFFGNSSTKINGLNADDELNNLTARVQNYEHMAGNLTIDWNRWLDRGISYRLRIRQ